MIIILSFLEIFACSCEWYDTIQEKNVLFNNSQYVFIGIPYKNIIPFSSNSKGYEYLVDIQKVYKGEINTKTVMIIQHKSSNCAALLSNKDSILFFVNKVDSIKKYVPDTTNRHFKPGYKSKEKTFYLNNGFRYQLIKNLHKKHLTFTGNQCVIFDLTSKGWLDYVNYLNTK